MPGQVQNIVEDAGRRLATNEDTWPTKSLKYKVLYVTNPNLMPSFEANLRPVLRVVGCTMHKPMVSCSGGHAQGVNGYQLSQGFEE